MYSMNIKELVMEVVSRAGNEDNDIIESLVYEEAYKNKITASRSEIKEAISDMRSQ